MKSGDKTIEVYMATGTNNHENRRKKCTIEPTKRLWKLQKQSKQMNPTSGWSKAGY